MASKQLLLEQEAVDEVRDAIVSVSGKRWMIAVWCIDEAEQNGGPDLSRLVNRTTWRFPHNRFPELLRLLNMNLEEELSAREPPVPAPLEMASFLSDDSVAGGMKDDSVAGGTKEDFYQSEFVIGELPVDKLPADNLPRDEQSSRDACKDEEG